MTWIGLHSAAMPRLRTQKTMSIDRSVRNAKNQEQLLTIRPNHAQRRVVDISKGVPPRVVLQLLREGRHYRLVNPFWPQSLDGVNGLHAANIDDNPKHVRLAKPQRHDTQGNRGKVGAERASVPAKPSQMVQVRTQNHSCRSHVGVIETREEEQHREQGDVDCSVERVLREYPELRRRVRLVKTGLDLMATQEGQVGQNHQGDGAGGSQALSIADIRGWRGAGFDYTWNQKREEISASCQCLLLGNLASSVQSRGRGDLVIPLKKSALAVLLRLRDMENLIL